MAVYIECIIYTVHTVVIIRIFVVHFFVFNYWIIKCIIIYIMQFFDYYSKKIITYIKYQ